MKVLVTGGTGFLGSHCVAALVRAGHDVSVYNRTQSKAEAWADEYGGRFAATPREASENAGFVFTCVGNDDDLRDVVLGEDGVLAGLAEGGVLVDHSTVSCAVSRELSDLAVARGCGFLDAPISGGQVGAEKGILTVMVGGEEEVFSSADPVIQAYARAVTLMGPVGSGQLTKMVNQIAIAGVLQGLAEAVNFASISGLDVERVFDVLSKGAAQSWQMDNRAQTMADGKFDFGFAVDWMRKDLGIAIDEARRNGAQLPVAALVDQFYALLQARGRGRWEFSSLITLLQDRN